LKDDDFDQVYALSLLAPQGRSTYRVALGADLQPVYGVGGKQMV